MVCPERKEGNNGDEHDRMQKVANFTFVCIYTSVGLNSKHLGKLL